VSTVPEPLVGADIDLEGFPGFILDVEHLLASELVALATTEELSAALMLWCRAYQQKPHGSLPNNERVLAAFSKAKNWKKVRDMALRGFVLCSDGRLYHKFLSKKVLEAWDSRQAYQKKREKDAERLRDWREKKSQGNANGNTSETRFKTSTKDVRSEDEVKGSEITTSVPIGTGAVAPLTAEDRLAIVKKEIWSEGKALFALRDVAGDKAGKILGRLLNEYSAEIVLDAVRAGTKAETPDPTSYLKACCQRTAGERANVQKNSRHSGFDKTDYSEGVTADGRIA
jgi:uncharacterized protein YdaU (DUF1376 family)